MPRFTYYQIAEKCSQLAGTSNDCILTRLLRHHLKDDGITFEGEDDLKETIANIYLGACCLLFVLCLSKSGTSRCRNGIHDEFVFHSQI